MGRFRSVHCLWSAPQIAGFTTQRIVQAVPTSNGTPDLYSIEQDQDLNVMVRAFTSDGRQLWQSSLGQFGRLGQAMGDNFGGLLLNNVVLDGQTGTTAFTLPYSPSAIGQDGSIYSTGFDVATGSGAVFRLDPNSGQASQIFTAPIGINTKTMSDSPLPCESGVSGTGFSPGSITSGIVVDANGTIWFGYQTGRTSSTNIKYCLNEPTDTDTSHTVTSNLASISTAGVLTTLHTGIDTQTCIANTYPATGVNCTGGKSGGPVFALTPDGNGGALIQFADVGNNNQVMMQSTSGGSPYPAPLGGGSWVLGENNTAFLTDGSSVASFNPASGVTNWSYQAVTNGSYSILAVGVGNNLAGKITSQSGVDSILEVDDSGNATTPINAGSNTTFTEKGNWNAILNGSFSSMSLPIIHVSWTSDWAMLFGNAFSSERATKNHSIGIFWCGTGYGEQGSCSGVGGVDVSWKYLPQITLSTIDKAVDFSSTHPEWVTTIQASALDALQKAFSQFPVSVELASTHNGTFWECANSLKMPGCVLPSEENRVYISGVWPGDGSTGETTGITPLSFVYYWLSLQNSESALQSNPAYPPQSAADNQAFLQLFHTVGTGLGNTSAHELGHQIAYSVTLIMHCNATQPSCANNDTHVFEFDATPDWWYTHVYPYIHWQNSPNSSVCAIHEFFDKHYRDANCTLDLTK